MLLLAHWAMLVSVIIVMVEQGHVDLMKNIASKKSPYLPFILCFATTRFKVILPLET
jgi:hypothetical protein